MNPFRMTLAAALSLALYAPVFAQTDDPSNSSFNVNTSPRGSLGNVIGTAPVAIPGGGTPVGLEQDGAGNLFLTDIVAVAYAVISPAGAVQSGPTAFAGGGINPLGITSDGPTLFVTDATGQQVIEFDFAGTAQTSFSVSAQTTFPEGVTIPTFNANLFVVDGSGGSNVYEYDTSGTLLNTFPINGTSQDGIAFDGARCVFWVYDSGTDTVRSYDSGFTAIDTFPGTGAAGQGSGEGVAVIGDSLFVMAPGTDTLVEFDISAATPAANAASLCPQQAAPPSIPVPALGSKAMMLMLLALMLGGGWVLVRRNG